MKPYYASGAATLYFGDCLEILPLLPDDSASAVILDPPYAMSPVAVRGRDDGAAGASGAPMRLLSESLMHTRRILRKGGVAPIICDWRRVPDVSYMTTLAGLRLTTCIAWTRTTIGTGGMFRSASDPVLVAANGQPDVVDRAGIPNVIEVNPPRDRVHPYEKPPALWRHILQRIPTTATVVDPFAGSAASAVAAISLGFPWVGVEVDEAHCENIANRLSQDVLDFGASA